MIGEQIPRKEFTDEFDDGTVILVREWGEPPDNHHSVKRIKPSYFGPVRGGDRLRADYAIYGYTISRHDMIKDDVLLRIENEAIAKGDWATVSVCKIEHWLRNRKALFDNEWVRIGKRPDISWDRPNCPTMKENLNNPKFVQWLLDDELGSDPNGVAALQILRQIMEQDDFDEHKLQRQVNGE